jgi:hypothetical protein
VRWGAALALLGACATDLSPRPVARIRATPSTLPEGDAHRTAVTLDARGSEDSAEPPQALSFRWTLEETVRVREGSLEGPTLRVTFEGRSPSEVWLQVRTADGREATARARVALTLR